MKYYYYRRPIPSLIQSNPVPFTLYILGLFGLVILNIFTPRTTKALIKNTSLMIPPIVQMMPRDTEESATLSSAEVLGFAPYWTLHKLDNVDFSTLTTFAYFGVPVDEYGRLDRTDIGFERLQSAHVKSLFQRARDSDVKNVVTLTQMENEVIRAFLDDPDATDTLISESVALINDHKLDGINIDFEYLGDPKGEYKQRFSHFVENYIYKVKQEVPSAYVTVSVYASAAKEPKLYDIARLGAASDGVLMMAYDFATTSAKTAMPTAPLNGYKEGKYWYDVKSAVEDFSRLMPANKIILGVPYYGYNYPVKSPESNATILSKTSRRKSFAQVYSHIEKIHEDNPEVSNIISGWDEEGQVSWKAYKDSSNTWRLVFAENTASLAKKYDMVKANGLKGVGIWALGFDEGRDELWQLLSEKFGSKQSS